MQIFLQRLPLTRFLAKILRIEIKNCDEKFLKKICRSESSLNCTQHNRSKGQGRNPDWRLVMTNYVCEFKVSCERKISEELCMLSLADFQHINCFMFEQSIVRLYKTLTMYIISKHRKLFGNFAYLHNLYSAVNCIQTLYCYILEVSFYLLSKVFTRRLTVERKLSKEIFVSYFLLQITDLGLWTMAACQINQHTAY